MEYIVSEYADPYEELANAIIKAAADDYVAAAAQIKLIRKKIKLFKRAEKKYQKEFKEIEAFFHSPEYMIYSNTDGEQILEELRKQFKKGKKKKNDSKGILESTDNIESENREQTSTDKKA